MTNNEVGAFRKFLAISIFIFLVAACASSLHAQQLIIQGGGIINFGSSQPTNPIPATPPSDILNFLDGSVLHGSLKSIDESRGVTWEHAAARKPFQLKPANLDSIQFKDS